MTRRIKLCKEFKNSIVLEAFKDRVTLEGLPKRSDRLITKISFWESKKV